MTQITADQFATLPDSGQQIPLEDWNLMVRAIKQLLDVGGGGTPTPENVIKMVVGTETWTIAGFKDGSDRRFVLLQVGDVDDITTATAHFAFGLQKVREVT